MKDALPWIVDRALLIAIAAYMAALIAGIKADLFGYTIPL